jgi:predicted AlkP superfamily phosphohydrolase/phosphomutase/Flp pilus assembly protein TadD
MSQVSKRKVLIVGWDAADWKFINPLLDAGLMPNLSGLVDQGVIANLASLKPSLSPILWTSIATGKMADKHGILGFVEPSPEGGVRLSTCTTRKTKAIWNILSQSGYRSVVVNWYASHPAEPIQGCVVSQRFFESPPADPRTEWPVIPQSVHPHTLGEVISSFRMHPQEVSLADLSRFIPKIDQADWKTDRLPGILAEELAKTASVHAVATGALEAEEWDVLAVYYDGIDTLGHHFMPFHPPRMEHVNQYDFDLYKDVMRQCYLFHDEMLGRLLDLAGSETTVILLSDHGFHSDHLRPRHSTEQYSEAALAATWHRHYGVLAMRGPDLLSDERIYGVTLLDIAPTLLALLGLPVGEDMDGKILLQAFRNPPAEIKKVESWDGIPGDHGQHPRELQQLMNQSPAAIAQLVALGYLPAQAPGEELVETAIAESQFNLAIVLSSKDKHTQALPILQELYQKHPDNERYSMAVAKTLANLAQHDQALEVISQMEARGQRNPEAEMLAVAELFNVGRTEEAEQRLRKYQSQYPPTPYFYVLKGSIHSRRSQWHEAYQSFQTAGQLDGDDPHIQFQLAYTANQLGRFEDAAEAALQAISTLYFYPQAHYQLGYALKGMGDLPRAIRSFQLAVSQSPQLLEGHQRLAEIYEQLNDKGLWLKHQRLAKGLPADH